MRIDGAAHLSTDDDLLARFTDELRQPTLAVVIEIETVFTHCAKSFRRGGLWDPTSWPHPKRPPMLDARYRQLNLERTFEEYAASNERVIREDLAADKPM